MTIVAVVVYDRFQNMIEWIRCWAMCEQQDAKLVIIHNNDDEGTILAHSEFCASAGIHYIRRPNVGFDIGAFQDVCRNRLEGFPEYDTLIWCCDDALPMRKDFVKMYLDRIKQPGIGCVALEVSRAVRLHIRTTCFCITKQVAERLQFVADPITTKEQCYHFEHRGGTQTFLDQIVRMGLKALQVAPIAAAPFWDSGFKKYKSREKEHYLMFPKPTQHSAKVAFICPIYNSYPEIISSLINQTHQDWHLFLIHDGPSTMDIKGIVNAARDHRITYIETEARQGNWGHGYRKEYLEKLKTSDFDYVVITNGDNHHAPVYCEYMLKGFTNGQLAVYCDQMVHSYKAWGIIDCKLQLGYLDCAGVMVRKDVACEVGWNDTESHSSDWTYFSDIIKKHGANKFGIVKGCLLNHN
jgi:hypothetical protein